MTSDYFPSSSEVHLSKNFALMLKYSKKKKKKVTY